MAPWVRWLPALLLIGSFGALAGEASEPTVALSSSGQARVGETSPWFAGFLAGGGQRVVNPTLLASQLDKENNHALAILFFGTWCKPCEAGLRRLAAEREALRRAGVSLLLVALVEDGESLDGVATWVTARGLGDVPLVIDRFAQIARPFGAESVESGRVKRELPLTAVLGADGKIKALFGAEGADFVLRLTAVGRP